MVDIGLHDMRQLAAESGGMRVSIFIPTKRGGGETMKNSIRLKNKLKEAEKQLEERGWRPPEISVLLEPGYQLVDDKLFREQQKEGLALFLEGSSLRRFQLPTPPVERLYLGEYFQIKPLFQALSLQGKFYVLALSQKDVRLLRAKRDEIEQVELTGVPTSMQEALRFDDPEKQLQHHSQMSGSGAKGGDPAGYHGHGGGESLEEKNIIRFFQAVDRGLHNILPKKDSPLVLAGVDYLLPLYRGVNHYPNLVPEGIPGNPIPLKKKELLARGWQIVEPRLHKERDAAIRRFQEEAHLAHCSDVLARIVQSAYGGQVEILFVRGDVDRWGSYDLASNHIDVHKKMQDNSVDLLNLAAIHTVLNGGTVHVLNETDMPAKQDAAAVLRY